MKRLFITFAFLGGALAQQPRTQPVQRPQPTVIVPDGLIPGTRKEDHRVDLSTCDEVQVDVQLSYASISNGKLSAYSFKRYGHEITVTCTMVK